jgi:hypothetical protein
MATRNPADSSKAEKSAAAETVDASDHALNILLDRLKTSIDPDEIRELSRQVEQVIFHKQFENA